MRFAMLSLSAVLAGGVVALPCDLPETRDQPVAQTSERQLGVSDFAWLGGRWTGHVPGSGEAQVTFMPPEAGQMTGVMRLIDSGHVVVVELISMVDTPDGVELRFRHFSQTLDAYETSFKQTMRLKTHASDYDVFENLVPFDKALMSTQPRITRYSRHGADEFVAHSDIIDAQEKSGVIEVTYRRAK